MNAKNLTLTILLVILLIIVIATYPTIYHLQSTNSQLEQKIEQLQGQNKKLQRQLNQQRSEVEKLSVEQNKENAEETAIRFIETLNSSSLTEDQRAKQLKQMMTPSLYEQKFGFDSTDNHQETPVEKIRVKLKINQVVPANIGNQVQVNINYDLLTNVDNKENYTQKINTVVTLSPQNNKWIIVDFNIQYLQGNEGDI
jgi:hypothetical protein